VVGDPVAVVEFGDTVAADRARRLSAMEYSSYSDPAVAAFVAIPALLVVLLLWGTRAAGRRSGADAAALQRTSLVVGAISIGWLALTWAVAEAGVLREWERTPPPLFGLVIGILALACALAFSRLGGNLASFLPLWALVGVQGFRLPLELAMHTMYERGIMPGEMTYTGRNFDIVTGATAIAVAAALLTGHAGRRLVLLWNVLGLGLLVNVVTVAILATPRFKYFGDERLNVWVTYPPYVWLPAAMVLAALAGHLVIFRALAQPARNGAASPSFRP
jgi:hypothetical protein